LIVQNVNVQFSREATLFSFVCQSVQFKMARVLTRALSRTNRRKIQIEKQKKKQQELSSHDRDLAAVPEMECDRLIPMDYGFFNHDRPDCIVPFSQYPAISPHGSDGKCDRPVSPDAAIFFFFSAFGTIKWNRILYQSTKKRVQGLLPDISLISYGFNLHKYHLKKLAASAAA